MSNVSIAKTEIYQLSGACTVEIAFRKEKILKRKIMTRKLVLYEPIFLRKHTIKLDTNKQMFEKLLT